MKTAIVAAGGASLDDAVTEFHSSLDAALARIEKTGGRVLEVQHQSSASNGSYTLFLFSALITYVTSGPEGGECPWEDCPCASQATAGAES